MRGRSPRSTAGRTESRGRLLQNHTTRGTAWGPLPAGAIITSIPVVVFFLIIPRNIAAGLTAGAVPG